MEFFGESAALATAFFWTFTTIFFAEAARLIGSFKVNKIRLALAAVIYTIVLYFSKGHVFPDNLIFGHVFWLGLSGIIGFVIGDGAGFKALVMIGPRLAVLVYSSAPVMATFIAWFFLGEQLNWVDILGVFITVGGISWVVSERQYKNINRSVDQTHPDSGTKTKGIILGAVWGFGQAAGLVLSKYAMLNLSEPIEPMEASFIRILVALTFIWIVSAVRGNLIQTLKALKNMKALAFMIGGAVFGPFLGVWMSLLAVKYIAAGIAATLNSTTPIWLLAPAKFYYKEKLSFRIIFGTILTVAGIALLMLQ